MPKTLAALPAAENEVEAALRTLYAPRSVAVVGASNDPNRFGGAAFANILAHGFEGEAFPVNPQRDTVMGRRAYPSISAIGRSIDTAVIAIGADGVVDALRESEAAGAQSAIVVSSGFSEGAAGPEGQRRAEALQSFLASSRLQILGPSTTGLFNLLDRYFPRAAANQLPPALVKPGPLGLVSQSGAINNIVYNRAQQRGVGVGIGLATGVQMQWGLWDLARHLLRDPRIEQIAMVVEQFGDAEECSETCRLARDSGKSIIALKLGRTTRGAAAVQTHSGALAGSWAVQESMLRDEGVLIAEDLDQVWELGSMLQYWGSPRRLRNRTLGVLAFSGGEGALLADTADDLDLDLPPPSAAFAETAKRTLPLADCTNPFDPSGDIIGRDEAFVATVSTWIEQNDYGAYLVAGAVQGDLLRNAVDGLRQAVSRIGRPVMESFWPVRGLSEGIEQVLTTFPGPVFENSVRALKAFARYRAAAEDAAPVAAATAGTVAALDLELEGGESYWDLRARLGGLVVPFPEAALAQDAVSAAAAASRLGFPVVVKANVPNATHKSAAGLVRVGLLNAAEVEAAVTAMGDQEQGFVVEAQASGELQVYVGAKRDPELGPAIIFGTGGVAVEFVGDVATRLCRNLHADNVADFIGQTRIGRYLAQRSPAVVALLADLLLQLSSAFDASGLVGVDFNPVIVSLNPPSAKVVDARIS